MIETEFPGIDDTATLGVETFDDAIRFRVQLDENTWAISDLSLEQVKHMIGNLQEWIEWQAAQAVSADRDPGHF
jgi:hypothetical protein